MDKLTRNSELESFTKEIVRDLYRIPMHESVETKIVTYDEVPYIRIYSQYLSPKPFRACIDGLMEQLRGVESISYYLKSKTRFIRNIIKNSIRISDTVSPFVCRQFDVFLFSCSQSRIKQPLETIFQRANNMNAKMHSIANEYALDISEIPLQKQVNKLLETVKAVKNNANVKKAKEGDFSVLSYSLNKGVFTVCANGIPVYDKDLVDETEDFLLRIDSDTKDLYKNFIHFFTNQKWDSDRDEILKIIDSQSSLTKNKNIYKMFCDVSMKYICHTNNNGTDYFIKGVSLSSQNICEIYKEKTLETYGQEREINKKIYDILTVLSNPMCAAIVSYISETRKATGEDILKLVSKLGESGSKRTEHHLNKITSIPNTSDVTACLEELVDRHYVTCQDDNYVPSELEEVLLKVLQMSGSAQTYISNYCLPLSEEMDVEYCQVNNNHKCNGKSTCPLCGGIVEKKTITVPRKALKMPSELNFFQMFEFLKTDPSTMLLTQEEEDSLIKSTENPNIATQLKEMYEKFFAEYKNGEYLPVVQLKLLLYAASA